MILEPVKIDDADLVLLRAFNVKREAAAAGAQQLAMACERRNVELMTEGRQVWEALAKKYNLDIEHISYDLKGEELVPIAARFV